jgi:hypothetical protein
MRSHSEGWTDSRDWLADAELDSTVTGVLEKLAQQRDPIDNVAGGKYGNPRGSVAWP